MTPSSRAPALVYLRDGSLLLGTATGMRWLTAAGCLQPALDQTLSKAEVLALAMHATSDTIYALVGGEQPGLWRSQDGGKQWEQRASLSEAKFVNALLVSRGDGEQLHLSVSSPTSNTLLTSSDGGRSFTSHAQAEALTLLSADRSYLWALRRDEQATGNRGYAVMRSPSSDGPWQKMLTVNYFGGFTIDEHGVLWVGDEIGGIYRSDNAGESFLNLERDAYVSCLAHDGAALWTCTPGTPTEPALRYLTDKQVLQGAVSLAQVERQAACEGVERICANAWVEWQRDVRGVPGIALDGGAHDGGLPEDSALELGDAEVRASEPQEGDAQAQPQPTASSSCAVTPYTRSRTPWLLITALLVCTFCRRPGKRRQQY